MLPKRGVSSPVAIVAIVFWVRPVFTAFHKERNGRGEYFIKSYFYLIAILSTSAPRWEVRLTIATIETIANQKDTPSVSSIRHPHHPGGQNGSAPPPLGRGEGGWVAVSRWFPALKDGARKYGSGRYHPYLPGGQNDSAPPPLGRGEGGWVAVSHEVVFP
jgi:hypothetical protein